jgi:Tfp pilus assembly protein PilO
MKKIILIFTLVTAIVVISGYKQTVQNKKAETIAKQVTTQDLKGIRNPEIRDSGVNLQSFKQEKASESIPGILLILTNDKNKPGGSTSLLWNLVYGNPGNTGC